MSNWKAPGQEGIRGFSLKRFSNLHEKIGQALNDCVAEGFRLRVDVTRHGSAYHKGQKLRPAISVPSSVSNFS